jgi:hypothetical protein
MMMLLGSLREIRRLALVCLTIVLVVTTTKAQQKILWQGAVMQDRINVYATTSTRDRVSTTLKKGDVVDVVLEISALGDAWCRVAFSGQSEPLGYVLCLYLEQGHFTPKQIAHSEPVAAQSHAQVQTKQKTAAPSAARGPTFLTEKDVLNMSSSGLPPEVLVAKIKSSQCNFDTSPAQLQQLKSSGLPDTVILAMVEAPSSFSASAPPVEKPPSAGDDPPAVTTTSSPAGRLSRADLSIESGSLVYIEPMNGFESYLSAALQKKHVPIVIVASREKADFVITGASDTKKAGWAKIIFMGDLHSDEEASVTMINNKTGAVVFAYAVNKKNTIHGQQTSAEACAKHLKSRIEGKE